MSTNKANLWRIAALVLVVLAAVAAPRTAKASGLLNGLSLQAGMFNPSSGQFRNVTDFALWGGGIQYQFPSFPHLFNGDNWSTSISADFHYSDRKAGVFRYYPVSLNQVYTFNSESEHSTYAGFCVTAATFGASTTYGRQPTVTRVGGGLIVGANINKSMYVETRYEWIDSHDTAANASPSGFRTYLGYRF